MDSVPLAQGLWRNVSHDYGNKNPFSQTWSWDKISRRGPNYISDSSNSIIGIQKAKMMSKAL